MTSDPDDIPEPILWDDPAETITPDLRIKFRLLLSQNDLTGEKWERTQRIELWRERGMSRFCAAVRELGHQPKPFADRLEYNYRGKKKIKYRTGERLDDPLFTESILIIARLWLSDTKEFDIDNLHMKAVIDGFCDGGLCPKDTVQYIRGIFRWYEGIDKSAALSAEEKERRAVQSKAWRDAGMKGRHLPPPPNKRIWIDIYRLDRLYSERIDILNLIGSG